MTWEITFTFTLLGFALVSFIKEKLSTDVTAITVFAVLIAASVITHNLASDVALPKIEISGVALSKVNSRESDRPEVDGRESQMTK